MLHRCGEKKAEKGEREVRRHFMGNGHYSQMPPPFLLFCSFTNDAVAIIEFSVGSAILRNNNACKAEGKGKTM
jgi:hypothetical protein